MELLRRFKNFILLDVKSENESKKIAIILRMVSFIMCFYSFCMIIFYPLLKDNFLVVMGLVSLVCYLLCFNLTYHNSTHAAAVLIQLFSIIWIVVFVFCRGWDYGVQHFLFALLVLFFSTSYCSFKLKILYSIILCMIRFGLYCYCKFHPPAVDFSMVAGITLQLINTISIYGAIACVMAMYSKDSQKMEKKLITYNQKLHKLASTDALTELHNRRSMLETMEQETELYHNGMIDNLTFAIADIDKFKSINDKYGHECGDMVLKSLAKMFAAYMEDYGYVGRWGGEEFVFLLHNINGDDAYLLLQQLQKRIHKMEIPYKNTIVKVTATFGVTEYSATLGLDACIEEADTKLYQGKEEGRDRVVY